MEDTCSNCHTRVIPMADGRCPSCLQPFVGAAQPDMSASERLAVEMQRQQERADRRLSRAGRRNITIGCALLFGGIAATVLTYAGASALHGGSYYVFYGAILAGIIEIFRGLGQSGPRSR